MILFGGFNYASRNGMMEANAILVWDWNREDAEKEAARMGLEHFPVAAGWILHGTELTAGANFLTPKDVEDALRERTEQCAAKCESLVTFDERHQKWDKHQGTSGNCGWCEGLDSAASEIRAMNVMRE